MSKIKLTLTKNSGYAEESQVNPMKWKTLFKTGENTFSDQSGWWICKDFLNDCVAFFREGSVFSIYGWNNKIKANDEGIYHLLNNISDKEKFLKNLEVVNKRLNNDLGCVVDYLPVEGDGFAIVLIPPKCWETTYNISLITLLIRLCNYDQEFKSWADIWKTGSVVYSDKHWQDITLKTASEYGFALPEQFKEFWYYNGPNNNSKINPKATGGTIHNCGIQSWSLGMKMAKAAEKAKAVV